MLYGLDNRLNFRVDRKYVAKHTRSYTTTSTTPSRFDSGLNILYIVSYILFPGSPARFTESRKGGREKGSNLGTFHCPFSCFAATDVVKAPARGDNSSVVQFFTNPYAFKQQIQVFQKKSDEVLTPRFFLNKS